MNNKIFLATTALEEFWNKNATNGLFLGEWCKLYDRKVEYEKLNFETLDYIWKDDKEIDDGIDYCELIYKSILTKLVDKINSFYNITKDYRYWDILLKPWLSIYIQVMYDKYRHIKLADKEYNNLYTYTLNNEDYQFISMPTIFSKSIVNNDQYNLQLYSQIIKYLQIQHINIEYKVSTIDTGIKFKSNIKNTLLKTVSKVFNKIFNKKSILIVSPYFKYSSLKKYILLSLKSNFLFVFDNLQYNLSFNEKVSLDARKRLFNCDNENCEFENIIFNSFIYNFPIIYLEGYLKFNKIVEELPIGKSYAIYSSNALYSNEIFKFYSASNINNIKLLYSQHGGNFGMDKKHVLESIEMNFSDTYFTFGWVDKITRVLPQMKLDIKNKDSSEHINFIMTAMPRYFYRFVYQEDSAKMLLYIENAKRFFINFKKIDNLVVRLYMDDYQWKVKERLEETGLNIVYDNKKNYYKQIMSARLNIFDHMHTGYLEALSMNKPTILIITRDVYYFRDSAQKYIQKLIDTHILFKDPKNAADFIDTVYNDIDKWWFSNDVQSVVKEFCYNYNRVSSSWADDWIVEFNKV